MIPAAEVVLSGITKRFAAVTALDHVEFAFRPGRVHALLGENGAGKSTLMGIAFGLLPPDTGAIHVGGSPRQFRSPRDAIAVGIGMVQQHFSLVPALTAAENVAIGDRGNFDPAAAAERVRAVAGAAGLQIDPRARVRDLSVEAQQRLEIVRALAHGARILILDEPTAVLSPEEASALLDWIGRFAADGGAVALVTHKVPEALRIADDITVLRGGRMITSGPARDFTSASLARAMFPDAPAALVDGSVSAPSRVTVAGSAVVVARNVSVPGPDGGPGVSNATFTLHAGELVGVAGVEGVGHAVLLRTLARLLAPTGGDLQLPADVSFVPADRHQDAVVLDFPLYENVELHHVGLRSGLIDWAEVRGRTRQLLTRFAVRAESEEVPVRALSGGNQQRFVLAREMDSSPALLVAENPTRGLDLQATAAIHERLRLAARGGATVVVYSSDLDEVLALADRVLVVHQGSVREVSGGRDAVARAMVGG